MPESPTDVEVASVDHSFPDRSHFVYLSDPTFFPMKRVLLMCTFLCISPRKYASIDQRNPSSQILLELHIAAFHSIYPQEEVIRWSALQKSVVYTASGTVVSINISIMIRS